MVADWKKSFVAALALSVGVAGAAERPWLLFNQDFWIYFSDVIGTRQAEFGAEYNDWPRGLAGRYTADVVGLQRIVDDLALGAVTHFLVNVNGQRAGFDSKTLEPIWKDLGKPGMKQEAFVRTMKALHDRGIDPYAVMFARCRERGLSPWVSVRMSDMHIIDDPGCPSISDFWRNHPEFRRYPNQPDAPGWSWETQSLDFAHPEVRNRIFGFVRECLERYDVDGVELDYTRFPWLFRPGRERADAHFLTDEMRRLRCDADALGVKKGHPITISCRLLACPAAELALGAEVDVWAHEGLVDVVDAGNHWRTPDFRIPVAEWKALLGEKVRFVPHVDVGLSVPGLKGERRRLTRAEYLGWADVMQAAGCRDLSLFNAFFLNRDTTAWSGLMTRGLTTEAVSASPRAYPLSHRDWSTTGMSADLYPQLLPADLTKPFVCSVPVGTIPPQARVTVALKFEDGRAECPAVTLNGVAAEKGTYPLSALRTGENVLTVAAAPGRKLVYIALEVDPGDATRTFAGRWITDSEMAALCRGRVEMRQRPSFSVRYGRDGARPSRTYQRFCNYL